MSGRKRFPFFNLGQSKGATSAPSQSTSGNPTAGSMQAAGALSTLLVPAGDGALERVMQEYESKLSNDDKEAFQYPQDIIGRLQEMQLDSRSAISNTHITRVEKVLQCLRRFMSSLTTFIQHHPEISSLVVGGFNCIMTLVLDYFEFFERLTTMMERIGAHLSYLTEYSRAPFQDSEQLQQALATAYGDLLEFYIKVRQLFTKKKGEHSYVKGLRLSLQVIWEPFEAQFGSIETSFETNALTVVQLASIDHQKRTLEYQMRGDERYGREEDRRGKEEENEKHRKILLWLSSDDFEEVHERHFKKRFKNTGQWLLEDDRFINWRDGAQSSLLWCYGAPGSGKTVLASLVIDHLYALYGHSAVTFIYCNYSESRATTTYIRLALKQLCRKMQSLPPKLKEIHEQHYRSASHPKYDELRNIFLAIIQQLGHVYFIVDALDECTLDERKNLSKFLLSITEASNQGTVKLFVTSRKESDIERVFQQNAIPTIEIEATKVDSDIEAYVKNQIEQRLQDGDLRIRNMALKDKILGALTTKAGGMFLWVKFQLDAICAEYSDNGIEKALARVPEDMNATYERILDNINKKRGTGRELARRVLIWTTYARKPLSVDDLVYAVSIERDTKNLEDLNSSTPNERDILSACANLVSIDQSNHRYVRFIHFSVQEFLTSHKSKYIETLNMEREVAHTEIAQTCMIFLTLFSERRSGLGEYALNEWPHHLLAGNISKLRADDQLVTRTLSFFNTHPMVLTKQPPSIHEYYLTNVYLKFSPPVLALIFDVPGTQKCWWLDGEQLEEEESDAIKDPELGYTILSDDKLAVHYVVAELDFVPIVQRLYNNGYSGNYFLSQEDGAYYIPDGLKVSSLYSVRSTGMAKFLLDNGISIEPRYLRKNFIDPLCYLVGGAFSVEIFQLLLDRLEVTDKKRERHRHALQAAAYRGNIEAIQLLLDMGVDVTIQGGEYGNALQAAAYCGEVEAIQLILYRGADVNIQGGKYGSALQAAAWWGKVGVIQLLLDNGADVNIQGGMSGTALQAAAYKGEVEVIRLLLDKGADVNIQGGKYGNALQAAAYKGEVETIRLLLDKGGDVNIRGGDYGNALQAAAWIGNIEAIRLLLDKGADVNIQGGKYGTALQAAASEGEVEVIQLLVDKGADVNIQGGEYGNALQAAAYGSEVEVVRLLLDKGAGVNIQGGKYGTALQAAASKGEAEAIQLLLDKGADVNIQGGNYGNVLQAAAYGGNVEAIQLILDQGLDVNIQGGKYGTALQAAAYKSEVEAILLLLDRGADVNIHGGEYGSALQAAASKDEAEAIEVLLDKGGDVNIQGGKYGTALQAAAYKSEVEVIRLLLDEGADVNTQGGKHGNALQAAACWSEVEVIQLLLGKGADVNIQGGNYGNVLQAAAYGGNVEAIKLILDQGLDVNIQGGRWGTALQAAACEGKVEAIRLLLDKGADVNIQGGKYGTALQAAASKDEAEAIQVLLDKGADVNIQGGKYGTALQAAAYKSEVETIWLLLDKGSDVNIQGGQYGNALQAAASEGDVEAIQLLLDNGADVNIQGGQYGNALQAAASGGNVDAIQLLLDKGADVNIQGGEYGNVLQAAAWWGSVEAIRLLLNKGTDVNIQGGKYGTALQAAALTENIEAIRLLLDNGADVNVQGGQYGNALQAAAWRGSVEAVQILLEKGADVHAQGGEYGTALQAALAHYPKIVKRSASILPVVELLLNYGAHITAHESGEDALTTAKELWKEDRHSLDAFMELLASRGRKKDLVLCNRKRDSASQGVEGGGSENSQKLKRMCIRNLLQEF